MQESEAQAERPPHPADTVAGAPSDQPRQQVTAVCGYLVRERPPLGHAVAFGPVVPQLVCLDCFALRRQASGEPLGKLDALPMDETQARRLRHTQLWDHQMAEGRHPQAFLPPADCDRACGIGASCRTWDVVRAVGTHTGLIRDIRVFSSVAGNWTAIAHGASTLGSAGVPVLCQGTATAQEPDEARSLALYEALERYCAGFWSVDELRPRSQTATSEAPDCGVQDVGMNVAMHTLESAGQVWVPAEHVYVPYAWNGRFHDGDSVGLACGSSEADALERAVNEVIERWIVMPWLTHTLRHTGGSHPWEVPKLHPGVEQVGMIATVQLGPTDRHVAAAIRTQSEAPFCAVGFGCHPDQDQALHKASAEATHVQAHMRLLARLTWPDGQPHPMRRGGLDTRLHAIAFDYALAARVQAGLHEASRGPLVPVHQMARGDVLWRNITTADVGDLGLTVVRALLRVS